MLFHDVVGFTVFINCKTGAGFNGVAAGSPLMGNADTGKIKQQPSFFIYPQNFYK